MDDFGIGPERKRRRIGESIPWQDADFTSRTEGEQPVSSTAVNDTSQQHQNSTSADEVEQADSPLTYSNNDESENGEDKWLVVETAKNELNEETEANLSPNSSDRWSIVEAPCAKWCSMLEDGKPQWNVNKLKSFLSEEEQNNTALLSNLVHGTVLSGKMHPLIFETSTDEDDDKIYLRSMPFFRQLLADEENGISKYESLNTDQKLIVAVGVRDLFLAAWHNLLDDDEKIILKSMVEILDETVGCCQVKGMNVLFYPSTSFKVIKFVEDLDHIESEMASLFAQVMDMPKLFAVFVDPAELSFHNFENIVPLDRWIEWKLKENSHDGLSLSLVDAHQMKPDREVFTCNFRGAACDMVKQLSALDLYVAPLNKATRGGERFIFHSTHLSKALSKAVRSSGVLSKLADGKIASSFRFVNYIFRCNRFAPGDAKFTSHLDTPYYDSAKSHVSKYTLIVYLTAGHNKPALRMNDVELNEIEEMTCVIFDQKYEHEGRPFIDNDKIFIRTELVFKDKKLDHNNRIASLFSEACYMTGQSVFDESLASYAHECFERANSLHWAVELEPTQSPTYLHKQFRSMNFLTNGYDYWFAKGNGVNAVDFGMVAVLDYFNVKINGAPFRFQCRTTTVRETFDKTEGVWSYLQSDQTRNAEALKRLQETDVQSLFKKSSGKPFFKRENSYDESEDEYENEEICCPFHCWRTFDAWENEEVQDDYKMCCEYTRRKLFGVPLLVLNQELVVNESNIKIVGDKMFFLRGSKSQPLPPINFAACWNGPQSACFIDVDQEIHAPQLLIPPIMLHESDQGYHMVLDFFRNDWMVRVDEKHVIPVPIITNDLSEETADELSPFLERACPSCFTPDELPDISEDSDDSD